MTTPMSDAMLTHATIPLALSHAAVPHPAPAPAADGALRALVVDDEPTARKRLVRLLGELPDVRVVGECGTGRDALRDARLLRPDVLFLDIAMPGLDGMAVARELAAEGGPHVVFVTAYDAHALEAFRVHAADYVLKPLDRERLRESVEHVRQVARREKAAPADAPEEAAPAAVPTRLVIRDGRRTHFVAVSDVLWVESFGNYARVHTPTARFIHRSTMAQLEAQLAPAGFVRIHRTAIVNGGRVVTMRPRGSGQYEVCLDTGLRLRVSRTYRDAVSPRGENGAPKAP